MTKLWLSLILVLGQCQAAFIQFCSQQTQQAANLYTRLCAKKKKQQKRKTAQLQIQIDRTLHHCRFCLNFKAAAIHHR
jgi:hypothetical protein